MRWIYQRAPGVPSTPHYLGNETPIFGDQYADVANKTPISSVHVRCGVPEPRTCIKQRNETPQISGNQILLIRGLGFSPDFSRGGIR
jgi:hypothetical protein